MRMHGHPWPCMACDNANRGILMAYEHIAMRTHPQELALVLARIGVAASNA